MNGYILKRICGLFVIIWTAVAVLLAVLFVRYGILPPLLRWIVLGIIGLITLLIIVTTILGRGGGRLVGNMIFSILLTAAGSFLLVQLLTGIAFWDNAYKQGRIENYHEKRVDTARESFNIYVAGVDNDGPITDYSRCDVNILMTVNPRTKKILITTTPRDAYVAIDGNEALMDKLTHAGIYGPDSSILALEKLYGVSINYYMKVNFRSFKDLVDGMGGVEIDIDKSFTSWRGMNFTAGKNHLDGEQALQFVRERDSFENGDLARGEHQQQVLAAIFGKLTSLKTATRVGDVTRSLDKNFITNMPTEDLFGLVNATLAHSGSWQMDRQIVYGEGQVGLPSYAMPGSSLYMMVINDGVLADAVAKIRATMAE